MIRWLLLTVLACATWPALASPYVTLGVFAYRPRPVMEEAWQPFADYLSEGLQSHEVRLRILNEREMRVALERNELDFVLTNPAHYIGLRTANALSGAIATLVNHENDHPLSTLGGVIVARKDNTVIDGLEDLAGKTVATPGANFLGGYAAQALELKAAGVDPASLQLHSLGQDYDSVVDAVLANKVDAGFIRTGILEQLLREGRHEISQLTVLNAQHTPGFPLVASTRLYPEWPFVALPQADETVARRISALLLAIPPDHRAARAARIQGFTIPADYSPVETTLRTLRAPPFDRTPDFTWHDIWARYHEQVFILGLAATLIVLLSARLLQGNRRLASANARSRSLAKQMDVERRRLSDVVKATQVGSWEWNVQTGALIVNARWAEIVGYRLDELEPVSIDTWIRLVHPDDFGRSRRLLDRHFSGERPYYEQELRVRHRDGHWVWIHDRGQLISRTPDGKPLLMAGAHQDITERKQAEDQLRLAASVFASSYEAILITDAENRIIDINPAFSRITGYSREDVIGRNPRLLSSGRQGPDFYGAMWKTLAEKGHWQGEIWNRRKNGEEYAETLAITSVRDDSGALQHHVAVFSDISSLKAHAEELDRIAHFDPLTGVPNRRLLADRLQRAIALARRNRKPLAVCMLDLDGFKPINDRFGHEAGDRLLIEIVRRLTGMLRATDTVARLGGDEFVLLLGDLGDMAVLDRVLDAVRAPVLLDQETVTVSASIGVTLYPDDDADGDTLLRHADQAMYRAKQLGRNCIQVFDAGVEHALQARREQVRRLAQALEQGEFVLHYQPQVDMVSGEVARAEALIRWQHPEQGLLPPASFLPALEGSELEIALGEWVVETALAQVASWREAGLRLAVSVNIGAHHLLKAGFIDDLRRILERHPATAPAQLELEIVESTAISDMDSALEVLTACRELGIRLALDDFGTGYASLAYFRKLPVDLLKIDRSFVRDMLDDPEDRAIVETVVHLARAFGRQVVAEGVETPEHAAALTELGCRLGQGYGIARPMPAEHIPGWIGWYAAPKRHAAAALVEMDC